MSAFFKENEQVVIPFHPFLSSLLAAAMYSFLLLLGCDMPRYHSDGVEWIFILFWMMGSVFSLFKETEHGAHRGI